MQTLGFTRSKMLSYFSLFIAGIGIGWLIGLSVSPVVSIVITSITGSAAAIIAALSGVDRKILDAAGESEQEEKAGTYWDINPVPLAALVVGLIGGSILGIYVRNNNLLGLNIAVEIQKWTNVGIPEDEIVNKLLEAQFSETGSSSNVTPVTGTSTGSVLFTVSADQCETLRAAIIQAEVEKTEALADALRRIERFERLPDIVKDSETLKNIVEEVLCPEN